MFRPQVRPLVVPDAESCLFAEQTLVDHGSKRIGTNLNRADTDGDQLNDPIELAGYSVTVNGSTYSVYPSPFESNSDEDGWNDRTEFLRGTDATKRDTDGDGTDDSAEESICAGSSCRSPLVRDRKITQRYTTIAISGDCDPLGNEGDFDWELAYRPPNSFDFFTMTNPGDGRVRNRKVDDSETITLSSNTFRSYIAQFGDRFNCAGWMQEIDDGADATLSWAPPNCDNCSFIHDLANAKTNDTAFTVDASLANRDVSWNGSGGCGLSQSYNWTVYAQVRVE